MHDAWKHHRRIAVFLGSIYQTSHHCFVVFLQDSLPKSAEYRSSSCFHLLCVTTSLFHFLSIFFFFSIIPFYFLSFCLFSLSPYAWFFAAISLSQYWTSHAVIFLELCSLLLTYSFVFLTRYEAHTTTSTALRQAKPPPVTAGAVVVRMTPPFRLLQKFRLKVAVSILFVWFFLLNVSLYMNGTCFLDIWEQMRSFPSLYFLLFTLILLSLSRSLVLLFIVS